MRRGSSPVPLGEPIANTQLYIVDERWQCLGASVTGELLIGGEGLARGYRHRPDLTAEKFMPNPFSETAGTRLYRTGDLVRYSAAGAIEFRGRRDNQLKLRERAPLKQCQVETIPRIERRLRAR